MHLLMISWRETLPCRCRRYKWTRSSREMIKSRDIVRSRDRILKDESRDLEDYDVINRWLLDAVEANPVTAGDVDES